MKIDRPEIDRYFRVGDIILSGGRRTTFRVTKITEKNVRIQPTAAKTASRLAFDRLELVIQHFLEMATWRRGQV